MTQYRRKPDVMEGWGVEELLLAANITGLNSLPAPVLIGWQNGEFWFLQDRIVFKNGNVAVAGDFMLTFPDAVRSMTSTIMASDYEVVL